MGNVVYALAVDSSGNLYAGGDFKIADGSPANHVAKWNGASWTALGTGIDITTVRALTVDASSNLYVGGGYTTVALGSGTYTASFVYQWNGTSWATVGNWIGMYDRVFALITDNRGTLYAGGAFIYADGSRANYVAKWNGTSWVALSTGMNDYVYALALDSSGNLYASGQFTTAGGVTANHVARWDGTSWSALGTGTAGGVPNSVYALAADSGGNVYAGGFFTTAGGTAANNIAKWNGNKLDGGRYGDEQWD